MIKGDNSLKESDNNLELLRKKANESSLPLNIFAILLSLLLHFILFISIPENFFEPIQEETYEDLELEILPPLSEIKPLPVYIEANPYANEEKPKDTVTKESFQDQRAADMVVDVNSTSDKPFVDGELENSQKIVSGNLNENPSNLEAMEITKITQRELAPPNIKELSSEDFMPRDTQAQSKKSQENSIRQKDFNTQAKSLESPEDSSPKEGESTEISVKDEGVNPLEKLFSQEEMDSSGDIKIQAEELKTSEQEETQSENTKETYSQKGDEKEDIPRDKKQELHEKESEDEKVVPLPKPKKRPSINMKLTAGPLVNNDKRASTLGQVAVDSSFSEFGAYQQRMLEAISRQWNLLANKYNLSNIANTVVVIEFYVDSEGYLSSFRMQYSNSSDIGKILCEQSIKSTAPYGAWTDDMRAVFGLNDQSVKITFHYR